jgi:hypothetical protein
MGQISRTTSGMFSPDTATVQSRIDSAKTAFYSGNVIRGGHFYDLLWCFYSFNDHYHSVDNDTIGLKDYGDGGFNGSYGGGAYAGAKNTGRMYGSNGTQGWDGGQAGFYEAGLPTAGDVITATKYNEICNFFNLANNHYHVIDDVTA